MIRTITIKNFLALAALTVEIDQHGALIEGGNGRGKTTVLKAIKAALDGAGISQEAVRKGETAAEILIDLDDDSVRRRITAAGATSLEVYDPLNVPRKKPVAFLSALLDLALLDPLDLFLAKPKERRAMVIRAVPCAATPAMLQRYLPAWYEPLTDDDCKGHGLDVVTMLRENVAATRTAVGRDVKEAERLVADAKALVVTARTEELRFAGLPTKADATRRLHDATTARATLDARAATAERIARVVSSQRAEVDRLRTEAKRVRDGAPIAPTDAEREDALERVGKARESLTWRQSKLTIAQERVTDLERQLREARDNVQEEERATAAVRKHLDDCERTVFALESRERDAQTAFDRALDLDEQANRAEAAVTDLGEPPTDAEREDAAKEVRAAELAVHQADAAQRAHEAHRAAVEAVTAKETALDVVRQKHTALDASVKALTNDAPRELLAGAAAGLTGLTIDGETILVDDGTGAIVDIERLSTAAQMKFALTIAKSLNARSKLLLVDGLERLDPAHRAEFVALAIEGGYQLFATRVTDGPLQIAPITGAAVSS